MNNNELVSIILPVYNGADHIGKAINSIIEQDYTNWELIIVNDCSTDNTPELINDFARKDNRIKVFNNNVNLKLPKSLNVGFSKARGDYLTWTSDDNMYRPNAIRTMLKTLCDNPGIDMVYSNYTIVDENDNIIDVTHQLEPPQMIIGNVIGACFLYTRKIAQKIGDYDSNLFLAEDYDYWMRIFSNGSILHIDDDLYLYRKHSGRLTETHKEQIQIQTLKAMKKNFVSLYISAIKSGQANRFFDELINRAGNDLSEEVREQLLLIRPRYKYYLYKKAFKNSLRNTIIYRLIKRS